MNIYQEAIELWGEEAQLMMAIEEMGELIQKIGHLCRGRCTVIDVAEEVADVEIMMRQLREIVGDELVECAMAEKLDRLEKRIKIRWSK